jgi:hypothetical protein
MKIFTEITITIYEVQTFQNFKITSKSTLIGQLLILRFSSASYWHAFERRHCGLARHFKTDPTETVALCFRYPKTPCLWADGSCLPEQVNRPLVYFTTLSISKGTMDQGYIVKYGQCSVFLIPINKRQPLEICVVFYLDGGAVNS